MALFFKKEFELDTKTKDLISTHAILNKTKWFLTTRSDEGDKKIACLNCVPTERCEGDWFVEACISYRVPNYNRENTKIIQRFDEHVDCIPLSATFIALNNRNGIHKINIKVTEINSGTSQLTKLYEFNKPNPLHNVVFEIKKQLFYVNRELLALHSEVFKVMLFDKKYMESTKTMIPLGSVEPEEFKQLLYVIYPCQASIKKSNVAALLKLANQFDMKCLIYKCEVFLIKCENYELSKKLLHADTYNLAQLMKSTIGKITTCETITALKISQEWQLLSDKTRIGLLEKFVELTNIKQKNNQYYGNDSD